MDRTERIRELLSVHKTMSTQQLCEALYCSPSSLRRDLINLEKTGLVRRIRGGAALVLGAGVDYSSSFRENVNVREKEYICSIAKDFIANGMSLFLDSSSTVARICPILEELRDITVVTNGIGTALLLNNSSHVDTFTTGGHLRKGSATLMGESSGEFLSRFKADLALISCRGIDEQGAYEADLGQALIKQHMIHNARNTLLLVDSSKFDSSYLHRMCDFSQVQAVISDRAPSAAIERAIAESGCEMLF